MSGTPVVADEEVHIYRPYKAGLPDLRRYRRDMWRRRDFIAELAKSDLKAEHSTTTLGQLWIVLNPLLLAGIYYLLILMISQGSSRGPAYFVHLLGGLFAFQFFSLATAGATGSVTRLEGLITNLAFPRLVLPIASLITALRRFVPMLGVYVVFHVAFGQPIGWATLMAIPAFVLLAMFTTGFAFMLATINVYFRDAKSFLPYVMRLWLYISPVLYMREAVTGKYEFLSFINPLFGIFTAWSEALTQATIAQPVDWVLAAIWSVLMLLVGSYMFLSRERDFSVRL